MICSDGDTFWPKPKSLSKLAVFAICWPGLSVIGLPLDCGELKGVKRDCYVALSLWDASFLLTASGTPRHAFTKPSQSWQTEFHRYQGMPFISVQSVRPSSSTTTTGK